jgi:hypothetical protein
VQACADAAVEEDVAVQVESWRPSRRVDGRQPTHAGPIHRRLSGIDYSTSASLPVKTSLALPMA